MARLNHFALSAALGSTIGPRLELRHGQLGSTELAASLDHLLDRRKGLAGDPSRAAPVSDRFAACVAQAYRLVRNGWSADRVVADPSLNCDYLGACRDLGLDNDLFYLNRQLLQLRKTNRLGGGAAGRSRRTSFPESWRYAGASEVAARAFYYRHGVSVDTLICHPKLRLKFDALAAEITPGYSPLQYRWAALNLRKKGASVRVNRRQLAGLHWSVAAFAAGETAVPAVEGIYSLYEEENCLFVGGTESIEQNIIAQRSIADVTLLAPELWHPDANRLHWRYAPLPRTPADVLYGMVNRLVHDRRPVFNIPRRGASRAE